MSRTELCIFACQDKQSIRDYDSWASRLKFLRDVAGLDREELAVSLSLSGSLSLSFSFSIPYPCIYVKRLLHQQEHIHRQ